LMKTYPVMGRPVKSIGRALGVFQGLGVAAGSRRGP